MLFLFVFLVFFLIAFFADFAGFRSRYATGVTAVFALGNRLVAAGSIGLALLTGFSGLARLNAAGMTAILAFGFGLNATAFPRHRTTCA